MQLNVCAIESADALELHVTATPEAGKDGAAEAREMVAAVNDVRTANGFAGWAFRQNGHRWAGEVAQRDDLPGARLCAAG